MELLVLCDKLIVKGKYAKSKIQRNVLVGCQIANYLAYKDL